MRILLVNDLPPGSGSGTEIYVDRLAKGLIAAGDDVELFAGQVRHGRVTRALDVWDPWARREVPERAHRFGAEVVHHHNVLRELSVSVLGVPREIPSMLTVHDFRMLGVGDGQRARMERAKLAKGRFDRAIARS